MKKCVQIVMIIVPLILLVGCQIVEDETGHHIRLSPFVHKQVGEVAQTTTDILGILSMFIPALAPIAAAGATGTYMWRRMGKQVTKYQTPLEHTVVALDAIKQNKKLWNQLKPYLDGTAKNVWSNPSVTTENTIREIVDKNNGAV